MVLACFRADGAFVGFSVHSVRMAAAAETTEKAEKEKAAKPVVVPLESDPTPKVTPPSSTQQRRLHHMEI